MIVPSRPCMPLSVHVQGCLLPPTYIELMIFCLPLQISLGRKIQRAWLAQRKQS